MSLSRALARPMLASLFVYTGLDAVRHPDRLAAGAEPVARKVAPAAQKAADRAVPGVAVPQDAATLVRVNGAVQLVAGLTLATGRMPRLSAAVLAGSLVPTTLARHRFWEAPDPGTRQQQRLHLLKNVSVLGGLLVAAGDTEGRPGVVWRTRHATKDARREARHLAATARREARLAAAKVG